jgi:hypothetical protein
VTALLLGGALQALGLLGIFSPLQPLIDALLIVQGVWFLATSITVGWQALRSPVVAAMPESGILGVHF